MKNQLGVVLGYSDLILEDLEPSHPLRANVEEILKAARRAMELLVQIQPVTGGEDG